MKSIFAATIYVLIALLIISPATPRVNTAADSPYSPTRRSASPSGDPINAFDTSGPAIDLFGGANNSGYGSGYPGPFPTPYGGQGPNHWMDIVFPKSEVTLYVNLTNNGLPVGSSVANLTIEGPYDRLSNGTIVKKDSWRTWVASTIATNVSGIADFVYLMPWNDSGPSGYMGILNATASAVVNGGEIMDTMLFYYEYLTSIASVTTDSYLYVPGQSAQITVKYLTHAVQTYPILFTIELKNATAASIDLFIYSTTVGGASWGYWRISQFMVSLFIGYNPTATGYAYVYVNCYDKHPAIGGVAWCPQYAPPPEMFITDGIVPDGGTTIQGLINSFGGITGAVRPWVIYVRNGTYHENIVVNSTVTLFGESPDATIIDGGGFGNVVTITANDVTMENFKIFNSGVGAAGIFIDSCSNTDLQNNSIIDNGFGLYVRYSSNTIIYHNDFINNAHQALVSNSTTLWDNGYPSGGNYWSDFIGIDLYSGPYQNITGSDGIGDTPYPIDANNTDHFPIMTLEFQYQSKTVFILPDGSFVPLGAPILRSGDLYFLTGNISSSNGIVIDRDNMTLDVGTFVLQGDGSGVGIYLSGRTNVTVQNAQIMGFAYGIQLNYSSRDNICRNNITNCNNDGILLEDYSSHNNIYGNCLTGNWRGHIELEYSSSNSISRNNMTNGPKGMIIGYSSNNSISENNVVNVYMTAIDLIGSSGNIIYHNNFPYQPYSTGSLNAWDNGYPSGGNYWGNYNGTDSYCGTYQNATGSDGMGDTPYARIGSGNLDNYPFMEPNGWLNYPISIGSNVTITDKVIGTAAMNFTASGPDDQTGYVNATMPVGFNSTEITVFTDGVFVQPIITSDGAHYFIYFEFALSTRDIMIQYAGLARGGGGGGRMPYTD